MFKYLLSSLKAFVFNTLCRVFSGKGSFSNPEQEPSDARENTEYPDDYRTEYPDDYSFDLNLFHIIKVGPDFDPSNLDLYMEGAKTNTTYRFVDTTTSRTVCEYHVFGVTPEADDVLNFEYVSIVKDLAMFVLPYPTSCTQDFLDFEKSAIAVARSAKNTGFVVVYVYDVHVHSLKDVKDYQDTNTKPFCLPITLNKVKALAPYVSTIYFMGGSAASYRDTKAIVQLQKDLCNLALHTSDTFGKSNAKHVLAFGLNKDDTTKSVYLSAYSDFRTMEFCHLSILMKKYPA